MIPPLMLFKIRSLPATREGAGKKNYKYILVEPGLDNRVLSLNKVLPAGGRGVDSVGHHSRGELDNKDVWGRGCAPTCKIVKIVK